MLLLVYPDSSLLMCHQWMLWELLSLRVQSFQDKAFDRALTFLAAGAYKEVLPQVP